MIINYYYSTMIRRKLLLLVLVLIVGVCRITHSQEKGLPLRNRTLFDFNWKFHRGGAQNANDPDFNDTQWRKIDLPHDWSIENLPHTHSPFDSNAISQVSGGFTTGGVGWYRKTFVVPKIKKGEQVQIQFDGIYMNADIWLNGHHLGNHPYGYTSFWYDITDDINFGRENVLAVQVKNVGKNSRWYSGSGIYRHVWLTYLDPVHIVHWGNVITTLKANGLSGQLNIDTKVKNETAADAAIKLVTSILDEQGKRVARVTNKEMIEADSTNVFDQRMEVSHPRLWSTQSPYRYTALTQVYKGNKLVDQLKTKFGVRTFSFDATHGFRLNGKSLKLKGGCVHSGNGPLGAKSYDRAEARKVKLLKKAGFNAVRCAHNPPAPAFLDACDSLGMLVIDEAFDMWLKEKSPYDYHLFFSQWWKKDLRSMISRDRNHPSIIMWSIGNEVPGMEDSSVARTAHQLAAFVHSLDTTRPVTAAVNNPGIKKDNFISALDVSGYNYGLYRQDFFKNGFTRNPKRVVYGSESFAPKAFEYWMNVEDHSWVIGDFVWTAWDYIGEAGLGWFDWPQTQNYYPWHLAYSGDFNICGWRRPQSYYRETLWKKNQLSLFVKPPHPSFPHDPNTKWSKWHWDDVVASWNWKGQEEKTFDVQVYSSCDTVRLFLNGKLLGVKPTNRSTKFMTTFKVPYHPGILKAVGYSDGEKVNETVLRTAKTVSQIQLSADRKVIHANGQDLSYITVVLNDANGIRNPDAENLLSFRLKGPGEIIGIGNANPVNTESYQDLQHKAWKGRCLVIVKSKKKAGNLKLTVASKGLPTASVSIKSKE